MVCEHESPRDENGEVVQQREELLGQLGQPTPSTSPSDSTRGSQGSGSQEASEDSPNSGENANLLRDGATEAAMAAYYRYRQRSWLGVNRNDCAAVGIYSVVALLGCLAAWYMGGLEQMHQESMAKYYAYLAERDQPVQPKTQPKKIVLPETNPQNTWRKSLESDGYGMKVFQESEIAYKKGGELFLVIAGHVFDVTSAERMYGEGNSYHGFIGRDCTRGFITGKYDDENCKRDITDLEDSAILEIAKWLGFYFTHATYKFVGVVSGLYFDQTGVPTDYTREMLARLQTAENERDEEADLEKVFPPCNVEWTAALGSRLWCSKKSGGIDRDWTGFPRQFTEKGKQTRCACVNVNLLKDPRVKEYKGCPADTTSCRIKE